MDKVRAADLDPVLKCECGHEYPNDQVLIAAQVISARLVQEQERQRRRNKKDRTVKKDPGQRLGSFTYDGHNK